MRIFTRDVAFEGIFDYGAGLVAQNRNTVAFPDTLDAVFGGYLDDHPESAADTVGRYCHPGFNIFQKQAISRACETRLRYPKSRVLRNNNLDW